MFHYTHGRKQIIIKNKRKLALIYKFRKKGKEEIFYLFLIDDYFLDFSSKIIGILKDFDEISRKQIIELKYNLN